MSRRMVVQSVYLTPEQSRLLLLLSQRTHVPQAVYIREGIDLVLAKVESEDQRQRPSVPMED